MTEDADEVNTQIKDQSASTVSLVFLAAYLIFYLLGALWLFVEGWLNQFHALQGLWGYPEAQKLPPLLQSAMFSMTGAIMGCGVLGIISFYRYVSVESSFQTHHLWGYYFAPVLAVIVGLITFALLQSGLLVFSGQNDSTSSVSNLGYLAVGFISGYGWYQFTDKVDELVGKLLSKKRRPKKISGFEASRSAALETEQAVNKPSSSDAENSAGS